jgi:PKD repeat protein
LPTGLVLSNSGVISGTPTTSGTFSFRVQATDAKGCTGLASYTIVVSSSCPPPESPFLSATPSTVNTSQPITLSWNATIAADQGSYTVLFSLNGGGFLSVGTVPSSSASTLSFIYVASTAGTYAFEVQAMANCGASSFSNISRVVVLGPCPKAPGVTGLVLTPTTAAPGASFTLSWNALGNFNGSYLVYRSTDGGKSFQLLATTSNTSFAGTVTDPVGTMVTFEVEGLVNCIFATQSNFVTLTVVSGNCTAPGAVSNVQIQSAGVAPARAPAPTEFIAVSWTPPSGGTPPTRYSVRLNGDPEVFVQATSVTLLPRGSRLDPIQAFVKALACTPETAGPEASSAVVALFLTSPKASFTVSSNPRANVAVVFTDTSSPQATSWLWVFDDGTTDQRQSPSHVFAVPGPHVVNFIASNGAGSSQTAQTIQVGAAGGVIEAARLVQIDTSDSERRRAHVQVGDGRTWLHIRALGDQEVVVFLRFLDSSGELVVERRLVVGSGEVGSFDLSAYGLTGEYGLELVGGGEYEAAVTVVGRPGVREMER